MNPTSQQGECLDEAFNVRVGRLGGVQTQPVGRGWILLGEILRELPNENQFALVVGEQRIDHVNPNSREWKRAPW